jgi:NAD(P)-dependent dehydrogenase (short-subunit alcohol dehydrogenase family)
LIQQDLRVPEASQQIVSNIVSKYDFIHGMVVNAGVIEPISRLDSVDFKQWKTLLDINVFSQMELIQKLIPYLRKSNASVLFVSSGAAIKGYPSWGPYCMSKAALNILCQTLSQEEPLLTCVAIRPGIVDTQMQSMIRTNEQMTPWFQSKFIQLHKENQLVDPKVPAKALVRLLLFPQSEYKGQFVEWDQIDVSVLEINQ